MRAYTVMPGTEPESGMSVDLMTTVFGRLAKAGYQTLEDIPPLVVATRAPVDRKNTRAELVMEVKGHSIIALYPGQWCRLGDADGAWCEVGLRRMGEPVFANRAMIDLAAGTSLHPALEPAAQWLVHGERGASSEALCFHLYPELNPGADEVPTNTPRDPSDFQRCVRFLEAVPDARDRIMEMSEVSQAWAQMAGQWDELEQIYAQERGQESAPRLYERLRAIN